MRRFIALTTSILGATLLLAHLSARMVGVPITNEWGWGLVLLASLAIPFLN